MAARAEKAGGARVCVPLVKYRTGQMCAIARISKHEDRVRPLMLNPPAQPSRSHVLMGLAR